MKTWIGAAIVSAALSFGTMALGGPAALAAQTAAVKAPAQAASSPAATDLSPRRPHRHYRPYYYARPYYYQPFPYYPPAEFPLGYPFGFWPWR